MANKCSNNSFSATHALLIGADKNFLIIELVANICL